MKLILARHAKSSWDDPLRADVDRVLNPRGRKDAQALGQWLAAKGYVPDQALVSTATRTQETLALMCEAGGFAPDVALLPALYHASDFQILSQVRAAKGDVVLLLGHNPGIGDFAAHFAQTPHTHADFIRYPTGATTVYQIDASDWSRVGFGTNEVVDFITPRELTK